MAKRILAHMTTCFLKEDGILILDAFKSHVAEKVKNSNSNLKIDLVCIPQA
jgi:hypothetical protein